MIGPCYRYRAELARVVDGDTYYLRVDLGFYASALIDVRLRGVNAPEHDAAGGADATASARWHLSRAKEIVVESHKDERSFERWVCDVYVDSESLADKLVAAGHAEVAGS